MGLGPTIEMMSTRLFPKGKGAASYELTGVASRCDWVVLSDRRNPTVSLQVQCGADVPPKHIFLSLRNPEAALHYFSGQLLPLLREPFILVSGSSDATVPKQKDRRWPAFGAGDRDRIESIIAHPLLVRWFAENLDDDSDLKMCPLPLGMIFETRNAVHRVDIPAVQPLGARSNRVLCTHRIRDGVQWDVRRQVSSLATTVWDDLCTTMTGDLSLDDFTANLNDHAFVLCVEGGGLDPSPKAWLSLLHGAIPIIRDNSLRCAYRQLPVVIVPDWDASFMNRARLSEWKAALVPWFDDPSKRGELLLRLSIDFWWDIIRSGQPPPGKPVALYAR